MASYKFHRWDNALKKCMEAKKKGGAEAKSNRWRGDPLMLNQEAHELPPEKQREALDMVEEAPPELRAKLAPVWKYCFAQWHVYDAGLEAIEKGASLHEGLQDELLFKDVDSLKKLLDDGELEQAKTAEKWTWKLLSPEPPAGTMEPWNEATAAPMLRVGRAERREGVNAFAEERYDKALWHFWQGLTLVARAPATNDGPHAKLRCDLYKNKAAAALKLQLSRVALNASNQALAIDAEDPKALYRKAQALEALGRSDEARSCMAKAGLGAAAQQALQAVTPGGDGAPGTDERAELDIRKQDVLESLVFIDLGVDSIAGVDMIRHIQAELPEVPLPLTFAFDFPTVKAAVSELLKKINGSDEPYLRGKLCSTVWRALCQVLGMDPAQASLDGRLAPRGAQTVSEEEAAAILADLKQVYEQPSWVQTARGVAKRVAFEHRAFLVSLKAAALPVQRPVLEARGFEPTAEGLRQMESAIVRASLGSDQVRDLLQAVRVAQQGGANGMWAVNMEPDGSERWDDGCSLQCWSQYVKADPFGPDRKNTNSAIIA